MKNLTFLLFLIVLFQACSNEKEEVRSVFNEFKTSVINKDGAKAAAMLDTKSLAWYDNIKSLALTAPQNQLKSKNVMTKLAVLALRQNFSWSEIEEMNSHDIFSFTLTNSFYRPLDIEGYEIVAIDVEDDKAVVACKHTSGDSGNLLKFIKEDTGWKVNFAFVVNLTNRMLASQAIENEDETIMILVKAFSKDTLKSDIWEPMMK